MNVRVVTESFSEPWMTFFSAIAENERSLSLYELPRLKSQEKKTCDEDLGRSNSDVD